MLRVHDGAWECSRDFPVLDMCSLVFENVQSDLNLSIVETRQCFFSYSL